MAFNAGSVVVRLGAELDRSGFEAFDKQMVKARKIDDINANLGATLDDRQIKAYNDQLDKVKARAQRRADFRAHFGADYDPKAYTAFERDLRKAEKASDDQIKANGRLRTSFGSLWGAGGTAFAAAGGAYAIVSAVKGITGAYAESQVSQEKMKAQLKALGIDYDDHAKKIDNVIQKTSQLTGLDDEDLQDAFTGIVRSTGDVNKALGLLTVTSDVARAKHLDVAKAGDLVAKVYNGNANAIKRLQIAIDPVTTAQDKLKKTIDALRTAREKASPSEQVAIDAQIRSAQAQTDDAKAADKRATALDAMAKLQSRVSGQAEAYGKTQQGAMEKVSTAFENLQETLGTYLAPTITKAANALAKFIIQLQDGTGTGGKVVKVFQQIGGVIQDLMPVFKLLGSVVVERVKGMIDQVQGIVRAVKGVSELVSGIAHGDWAKAWQGVKDIVGGALKSIMGLIRTFTAPFRVAFGAVWSGISKPVTAAMDLVERTVGAALDKVLGGLTSVAGVAESTLRVLGKVPGMGWAKDAANDLQGLRGSLDDARESMRKWGKESDSSGAKTATLSKKYDDLVGQLSQTRKGSEAYRAKAKQVKDAQDALIQSVAGTPDAADRAGKHIKTLGKNYDNLDGSVTTSASDIVQATNSVLSGLGAKPIKFTLNAAKNITNLGGGSPLLNRAGGGWIGMPGEMGPDDVPIVVGRGEAVLNRHQQGVIEGMLGDGFLDNLFANVTTPHYMATGGYAGVTGDTDFLPSLGNALSAMSRATRTPIYVSDGRRTLAEQQALVAQKGAWSPTNPGAAPATASAPHVRGIAADIRPGREKFGSVAGRFGLGFTVANESWHVQLLNAAAAGKYGAAAQAAAKIAKVALNGPSGVLKNIGEAAISKMTTAAQAYVDKQAGATAATGENPAGAAPTSKGSLSFSQLERLWVQAGGSPGMAPLMAHVAQAESGGNPNAHNASGATGLWQILGAILPGNLYNPLVNARNAVAKLSSQGLGAWAASRGTWGRYAARGGRFARGGKIGASVGKALSGVGLGSLVGASGGTQAAASAAGKRIGSNASDSRATSISSQYGSSFKLKPYDDTITEINTLGHQYDIAERVYQRDDSPLVDEDSGLIDEDALSRRIGELQTMIDLKRKIEGLWEKAQQLANQAAETVRTIITRLQGALKFATKPGTKNALKTQIGNYETDLSTWEGLADDAYWHAQDETQTILDNLQQQSSLDPDTRASAQQILKGLQDPDKDLDLSDYGDGTVTPEQIAGGVYDALQSFNTAQSQTFTQFGSNFVPAGVSIGGGSDLVVNAAGMRNFGAVQGQDAGQSAKGGNTYNNYFAAPPPDPHTWVRIQQFIGENA